MGIIMIKNKGLSQCGLTYDTVALPMYRWFMSSAQKKLREVERCLIESCVNELSGKWLCLAGFSETKNKSMIKGFDRILSLGSAEFFFDKDISSSILYWPLQSKSMDAVLLHHVLDWTTRPQRVLREASRVLSPGGSIIIMGFNPLSLGGLSRFFTSKYPTVFRNSKLITASTASGWLRTLGFSCLTIRHELRKAPFVYVAPDVLQNLQHNSITRTLQSIPVGNIYIIVAVKERNGLIYNQGFSRSLCSKLAGAGYVCSGVLLD